MNIARAQHEIYSTRPVYASWGAAGASERFRIIRLVRHKSGHLTMTTISGIKIRRSSWDTTFDNGMGL